MSVWMSVEFLRSWSFWWTKKLSAVKPEACRGGGRNACQLIMHAQLVSASRLRTQHDSEHTLNTGPLYAQGFVHQAVVGA